MLNVFKDHTGRSRYWILTAFCMLAIIAGLIGVVGTVNQTSGGPVNVPATIVAAVGALIFVAGCVALFIVGIWRLHNRGKSGFWIILYYPVPPIMALLADGPETSIPVLSLVALAIAVWAIIDLGFLDEPLTA
jgi:uncharacterized membrane protein YhaH (DUF805 family)